MKNWRDGVKRIPLHVFTWGLAASVATIWLGWVPSAFVLGAAIRGEYQDIRGKRDTVGKALIDFCSQVALPIALATFVQCRIGW